MQAFAVRKQSKVSGSCIRNTGISLRNQERREAALYGGLLGLLKFLVRDKRAATNQFILTVAMVDDLSFDDPLLAVIRCDRQASREIQRINGEGGGRDFLVDFKPFQSHGDVMIDPAIGGFILHRHPDF